MPAIAVLLSLLALVPFVLFGIGAVGHIPETAERMLVSLIDYAALILGFAGGVHWGLGLGIPGMVPQAPRRWMRFAGGALPLVVAWVALMLAQMVAPTVALAVLIAGYLVTVVAEHRAARRFMLPVRYVWVRWVFSVVGAVVMAAVLVLRGVGQTIVF